MVKTISTLYKKTTSGKTQLWEIQVDGDKFRTITGQTDGKKITSEWTVCSGKNIGQSNETTPQEQAIREAEAKAKKKRESGYSDTKETASRPSYFEPMLAHNWDDYREAIKFPYAMQPKLDGIRCIISRDGMTSRNGKDIISAPHIHASLKSFFDLYPNTILDGELYNHNLKSDFNTIVSLVKKTKPNTEDLKESEKMIQYHCYDMFNLSNPDMTFSDRIGFINSSLLNNSNDKYIKIVKTYVVNNSADEADKIYSELLEKGYEGGIIRILNSKYENKRSKNLLKRKDFQDSEFKILGVFEGEGNRTGTVGYMTFETNDGKPFKSNVKGGFEYLEELFENKESLVGLMATIKYFNLTPDGIPRFPFVISIRNYE